VSIRTATATLLTIASALAVGLAPAVSQASPAEPLLRAPGGRVDVVAVGDIACAPGLQPSRNRCQQARTAKLTRRIDPDVVLALGDLQYPDGKLRAFRRSYDRSWGTVKGRTFPIPGNHEYNTRGAPGYYTYFAKRQPGPPGYYARRLGSWWAYMLNSNCSKINCDKEARWLVRHLRSNPSRCALIATHHPRYSSGKTDSKKAMRRFFRIAYRHDVEMVLSGHAHHYERFRRMNARRQPRKDGVIQFVSGAGGASLVDTRRPAANSAFRNDTKFGVLKLSLGPRDFRFAFRTIAGGRRDAHTARCR
jgi:3',5'-cyclic AMP phosphodiesterase CpdA